MLKIGIFLFYDVLRGVDMFSSFDNSALRVATDLTIDTEP